LLLSPTCPLWSGFYEYRLRIVRVNALRRYTELMNERPLKTPSE